VQQAVDRWWAAYQRGEVESLNRLLRAESVLNYRGLQSQSRAQAVLRAGFRQLLDSDSRITNDMLVELLGISRGLLALWLREEAGRRPRPAGRRTGRPPTGRPTKARQAPTRRRPAGKQRDPGHRVREFLDEHGRRLPAGLMRADVAGGLTAVLAVAGAGAEAGRSADSAERRNALVAAGLEFFTLTDAEVAYVDSLPGVPAADLGVGRQFVVAEPVAGLRGEPVPEADDVVFRVERPRAREVGELTGQADQVVFAPGTSFVVSGVVHGPGRTVVSLAHPGGPDLGRLT